MNWIWIKNKFLNISKIFWQILDEGCTPFKPLIDINKSFHFRWRTFKLICMKLEMNKHICIYIYTLRIYYIINIIIYDKKKLLKKSLWYFHQFFLPSFDSGVPCICWQIQAIKHDLKIITIISKPITAWL